MKLELYRQMFEKPSDFMKIRPLGSELFHLDGQTDVKELTVPSRNFANASKQRKCTPEIN